MICSNAQSKGHSAGVSPMPQIKLWLWENRAAIVFAKSRLLHIISFLFYSINGWQASAHSNHHCIILRTDRDAIANTNTSNYQKEAASNHFISFQMQHSFSFVRRSSLPLFSRRACIYRRRRHFDFNNIIYDHGSENKCGSSLTFACRCVSAFLLALFFPESSCLNAM